MVNEKILIKDYGLSKTHNSKSQEIYDFISELDFSNGDVFCFKSGGDGDNGEMLMDLLNKYFEKEQELEQSKQEITAKTIDEFVKQLKKESFYGYATLEDYSEDTIESIAVEDLNIIAEQFKKNSINISYTKDSDIDSDLEDIEL